MEIVVAFSASMIFVRVSFSIIFRIVNDLSDRWLWFNDKRAHTHKFRAFPLTIITTKTANSILFASLLRRF